MQRTHLSIGLMAITSMVLLATACVKDQDEAGPDLDKIVLPEGFKIELYAENITNARSLALGDQGTVFVGNRTADKVYALVDTDNDNKADEVYVLASGLNMPNGVAFKDGDLYVAEVNRIIKFSDIENNLANPPAYEVVSSSFPSDKHHGWKFIAFGPDDQLYVPVGAPCNICNKAEENPIYATISRLQADGSGLEVYAHGIRNSVGFDWHPETGELWFTNNGRDHLGDNLPPDELNRVAAQGDHFGYPFCHGGDVPDPEFGKMRPCDDFVPPVQKLGPHVAALGMRFYTGNAFPKTYKNQIFIAEHGSWNRSSKIGYQISLVTHENNRAVSYAPFATGWLQGEEVIGRPVDMLLLPDGSMLVSDDYAHVIYRISYEG